MQALLNWFYFVGQQWLDSLKVFLFKNFKLFVIVTLNAWLQGAKTFFFHFWWLIFVYLFFSNHDFNQMLHSILKSFFAEDNALVSFFKEMGTMLGFAQFYSSIAYYEIKLMGIRFHPRVFFECLPYFLMLLAIRPSVKQKTYKYYFSYVLQYIIFVFFLMIVSVSVGLLYKYLPVIFGTHIARFSLAILFLFEQEWELFAYSPLLIFAGFFYLDSDGGLLDGLKSLWRGLKMGFYNLPFIVLTFIFAQIFIWEIVPYLPIPNVLYGIVGIALVWFIYIFYASWLNNFYIKEAHESYEVYF